MKPGRRRDPASEKNRASSISSNAGKRITEAKGTESGAQLLLSKLEGVVELSFGHWKSLCPCHEDTEPTFYVDVRQEPFRKIMATYAHCKSCGANGGDACRTLGLPLGRVLYEGNEIYRQQKPKYVEDISFEDVEKHCAYLHSNPKYLAYLTDRRGLTPATIDTYRIGYDVSLDRYTLPVTDEAGGLVNIRRYLPDGEPGQKMRNAAGHGSPARLYPDLPSGKVIICEGEWDCLVLRQHGFPAVTSTHGAETFLAEWVPLFAGRTVAFLYDCDQAGRTAARKHARTICKAARRTAVVDLDPCRSDKWDVSDWFKEGRSAEDLRALINRAFTAGAEGRRSA